jgi:hypothetical protein
VIGKPRQTCGGDRERQATKDAGKIARLTVEGVIRKLAWAKWRLKPHKVFFNAVSFSKGGYLGQELTARVQYTGAVRKRILPLFVVNVNMKVPRPWLMVSCCFFSSPLESYSIISLDCT